MACRSFITLVIYFIFQEDFNVDIAHLWVHFQICSADVEVCLVGAYCTLLTWFRYKKRLTVIYNDATRELFSVPRLYGVSHMFVSINVSTCEAVISNLMYKCMCRLNKVENRIIDALLNPAKSCTQCISDSLWWWRLSLAACDAEVFNCNACIVTLYMCACSLYNACCVQF